MNKIIPREEVEELFSLLGKGKGLHPSKMTTILQSHLALHDRDRKLLDLCRALISCLGCKTLTNHEKTVIEDAKKETA